MAARAYIDSGIPGRLRRQGGIVITVRNPVPVHVRRLALEMIRRHNTLEPELQATHRILLRWSENAGTGMPNMDAEIRETHYDPLPPDVQTRVTELVDTSPWARFVRKLYATTLTGRSLAQELGVSHTKLLSDRRSALWYLRGKFEVERIYG